MKQTYFFLLSMQILVKRCFLNTSQFSYLTDSVLPSLVKLHSFANSIAVYRFATAFPTTGASGG